MPEMQRIFYVGLEPATDTRLAGVVLAYGQAVDVPVVLAGELLAEPHYASRMRRAVNSRPMPLTPEPEPEPEPADDDEEATYDAYTE